MTEEEEEVDTNQALLFLDCWGTGDTLDVESFLGRYAYAVSDYAPEFVNSELPEKYRDHFGGVVTVLSVGPPDFPGYRVVCSYQAGEKECPGLQAEDHHTQDGGCHFCEGDDYVYWGDEWFVHVLVPEDDCDEDDCD